MGSGNVLDDLLLDLVFFLSGNSQGFVYSVDLDNDDKSTIYLSMYGVMMIPLYFIYLR
jgi:hypothetical protein